MYENPQNNREDTFEQWHGLLEDAPQHKERSALITCANALGLAMLLYLFLRVSVPVQVIRVLRVFLPNLRYFNSRLMADGWLIQVVDGICFLLCMAIPYGLYMLFIRIPAKVALPFHRVPAMLAVPFVFVALGVSVIGSLASTALSWVMSWFGMIPILPDVSFSLTPSGLLAALINLCILPAFLEECVFRGIVMQSLRRFGDSFALVVSALIFSLLHMNLMQAPVALLMGLVIGYFVLRTGSLWVGILIHFFNNFLALLQQGIVSRIPLQMEELTSMLFLLLYLVLGLLATILLVRGTDDMFRLEQGDSNFSLRQRVKMFFGSPAVVIVIVLTASVALRAVQVLP